MTQPDAPHDEDAPEEEEIPEELETSTSDDSAETAEAEAGDEPATDDDKPIDEEEEMAEKLAEARDTIGAELRKVIVGQDDVVEQMLIALLSGGHCLVTGAPGLAKTLLVSTLAQVFDLSFRRIQFTPD
ncbi:MAG: MoxR family ATPase, partial [Verrucomicrobiota bacterium]